MAETLRIFVSATNDLEAHRAIIGRTLAELPVKIRAEIRRTPAVGGKYDDIYELIANVDRVYFLLGRDISAPSGAEWDLAWKLERSVLPLRTPDKLTLAGQEFTRNIFIQWTIFRSATELARIVTQDLIKLLKHPQNRYGLNLNELELLQLHARKLEQEVQQAASMVNAPGGAEGGGVLLDDARREPVEGVLVGEGRIG